MKTFFTVLFITAAVVFLVCIIFRGETPDKPKKNIKSDNPLYCHMARREFWLIAPGQGSLRKILCSPFRI